jgi:MFS family permease
MAYLGFALLGLGVSVLVPLAYAHVGARVSDASRTTAIARISVIGYAGFFIGPPMMGGISEAAGLAWSFAAVAATLLTITLILAPALARRDPRQGDVHAR